jgi:O-succinylbenzoic acid--CoA ligase
MSRLNWLLQRALEAPEAPALESASGTWTFAELAGLARRAAVHLATLAGPEDAPVALLLPAGANFVAWLHGVSLAGRTVLPLNARLTAQELSGQLRDARVNCLLGAPDDPRLAELGRRVPGLQVCLAPQPNTLPAADGPLPGERCDPGATMAVLFTSGTSGRSKGACLSWGNFEASALATAQRLGPAVKDRWLACMPLYHVGGLSILMRSVLFGGPVRLQERFDAAAVSDALDGGDIAAVSLVPTMLSRLLDCRDGRRAPASLRVLLLGGAAAAPGLIARALAAGFPVCPTYGLTEACSQVATAAPPSSDGGTSPMLPLPGIDLRVLAGGKDAGVGRAGEIAVRGPIVMQRYLNDAESTGRTIQDGWLLTGDIGCLGADGALQVLDRRSDLVVSGGENVYPAEVEAVLLEHPAVSEAGVAGVPDEELGARVVAWVVKAPGAVTDGNQLQDFCRGRLAGYKLPREIRFVDALPRTAAGKLQRRLLARVDASS